MKIGVVITIIGKSGQPGFYNAQEIGLAKALDKLVDEVKVYRLVSIDQKDITEHLDGCKNASVRFITAKSFGNNGKPDMSLLDTDLDVLVYFSDTQFAVPTVYKWAKKNHIGFYPYIGVTESHSTNIIKKTIVDLMFKRNLKIYRNSHCFAKTPTVERKLRELGVNNITVVPVGLDQTLLKSDYQAYLPDELKKKYGYCETDKILLFIGRMIDEKQPLRMIEIFDDIVKSDSNYKLLMVGNGNLMGDVKAEIKKRSLDESVKNIERIPNNDIWELYRIADCFVNLNQQEIFGMAILEAMYYGCKVVAWHAPGPDFIIENGVSGWIVNSNQQVAEKIKDTSYLGENARNRILKELVWDSTAKKIYTSVNENLG